MTTDRDSREDGAPALSGEPDTLPRPTYWPAVLAASLCFGLMGVLTSVWLIVMGAAGSALAIARWLGELRDEPED